MSKTAKTEFTDPFAAVRKVMLETVEAMTANNEKLFATSQFDFGKARDLAAEQVEKAEGTLRANIGAAVAAGEVVTAGAEKANALVKTEVTALAEARLAAIKDIIAAKDVMALVDIQATLLKAEQEKCQAMAEALNALTQDVAADALKPVQAQVAKNLNEFSFKAA